MSVGWERDEPGTPVGESEDGMKFQNQFDVDAPIEEVWKAILDVERVAPCVPGAQVLERISDSAHKVGIKVKVGPITMQYRGDVEIVETDEAKHRAVMHAKAKETRGQGTADATVVMRLEGDQSHTHGSIETEVKLSGRAAAMGRGVIQDVSARIVDTFSANLAEMLGSGQAAEAAAAPSAPSPAAEADGTGDGETQAAATATATAEAPPRPAPAPPPAAASPPSQEGEALPIGSIVGSVAAQRLRDPKVLAVLGALLLLILRRRR
jgi:carbon monoxide dehydrogenase subunit G